MSTALVATGLGVLYASTASAATLLLVDSLGTERASGSLTDGSCESTGGTCTLRAAIEESNALGRGPGDVTIGIASGFPGGNINPTGTSIRMRTGALNLTTDGGVGGGIPGDDGAVFEVTAPVTIDLERKITIHNPAAAETPSAAIFYINGHDITLTGMNDVFSAETSFYISPRAKNVTITGISAETKNYYPERFFVVRGGAENVTISDNTVSGFYSNTTDGGWGWVDATSADFPVKGLNIVGNTFRANASGGAACSATTADGCSSSPLDAVGDHVRDLVFADNRVENLNRLSGASPGMLRLGGATIDTVTITGNTVVNPMKRNNMALIDFGPSTTTTVGTFTITENTFTDVSAQNDPSSGLIRLPVNRSVDSGLIAGNTFTALDAQSHAVYWDGPFDDAMNVTSSGVVIEDNFFDGWGDYTTVATVRMHQTGAVTMRRNVFGTQTTTQGNTVGEEGVSPPDTRQTMVSNQRYSANGKMNTWFPTARTSGNTQAAPVTAVGCVVPLEVAPPSDESNTADLAGARYPALPATLDVYWTAGTTAEVYLGSYQVTADGRTTLQVPLPRPDAVAARLPAGATVPVDPSTGDVHGGLRLQTQDPNAGATVVSSHLSRVATIDGTCSPVLTITQRDDQAEQSMARDRVFRLTSDLPLDPASVTAASFDLSGSTATRARVVKVTQVDETTFDVTVHADDTGSVVVTVDAGAVSSTLGIKNTSPATTGTTEATDSRLEYVNPLTVEPRPLLVVTGDPAGADYTITTQPGAPVPTADVVFTPTLDAAATGHEIVPSPTTPTITAGQTTTPPVTVTAPAATVTAGTPATIHHTVSSQDPNYDGLVVPDAELRLFSTAPGVTITKDAYTAVADTSSPQSIERTGQPTPAGSRLTDGQTVCWVYTVTNTSEGDWATVLRNITVTDTDTRLGNSGVIGTIETLPVGGSARLAACAAIVAEDTTQDVGGD